jgi:hypothetical protein
MEKEYKDNILNVSDEDRQWQNTNLGYENDTVSVSGIDTCKLTPKFALTQDRLSIIEELKTYNYKTPIYKISDSLERLFSGCNTRPGYWARIAEYHRPRSINNVLNYMVKQHGIWLSLQNPASYFTSQIKFRKKRKKFIKTDI